MAKSKSLALIMKKYELTEDNIIEYWKHTDDSNYEIDLTIARGLDYYTNTIFEIELKDGYFAYFDMDMFQSSFANINTDGVDVVSVRNGHVELNSNLQDDSMILTTIPYEKGWTLTIDGQPAQITVYQGALIGINPGQGQHEIVLDFSPPGIKTGAMISAVGAAGILLLCLFDMRKKMPVKTHGKKA